MRGVRGPLPGVVLALCFHGPLVAAGVYRYSWDAATHAFFADHYRRSWFGLWEPRWFGGFSVSSYPPLVHQLLALLSVPLGYDRAFGILLLLTLAVLPPAVWRFARLFVPRAAAAWAAFIAPLVPGVALAAHAFGQLPTLVSLTITLFLAAEFTLFVRGGDPRRLGLVVGLAGVAFAAHHATPLFLLPPLLLACLWTLVGDPNRSDRALRLRRAGLAGITTVLAGALVVLPFWLWALDGIHQAFIPHGSRSDFLVDFGAQALYLWAIDGVLPALAIFGLWLRADRHTAGLAILAVFLVILGLGGTTPLPRFLFGREWEWLTYDRFALWGAVVQLPLAGLALQRLVSARVTVARAGAVAAVAGLALYAGADSVSALLGPALPYQRDLRPVAEFLNAGRTAWRYQTFGMGDRAAWLGTMTSAATVDGTYYSARRLPELAGSGIGMLDEALWWDRSGVVLHRMLARADAYSIRWALVSDPSYEPHLLESGFRPREALAGGVEVYENPAAPPLAAGALRFGAPDGLGILWGTLPLGSALLVVVVTLPWRRVGIARGERQHWTAPVGAPLAGDLAGTR